MISLSNTQLTIVCYLVSLMLLPGMSQIACGVNLSFMPGDAFFHARLTRESVEKLTSKHPLELIYDYDLKSGTLGGYAGFANLAVENATDRLKQDLKTLYSTLRVSFPLELRMRAEKEQAPVELNGFHLFVYNRNVDFNKQRIGLKYNEAWMNLPPEALNSPSRKVEFWFRASSAICVPSQHA